MGKEARHLEIPESGKEKETERFIKDLGIETDRGAALIACAFLDDALDGMLRALFLPRKENVFHE